MSTVKTYVPYAIKWRRRTDEQENTFLFATIADGKALTKEAILKIAEFYSVDKDDIVIVSINRIQ